MSDPEKAISKALAAGVPPESLALYARWWQLERWLRDLAYMNLRAAWGREWRETLSSRTVKYAAADNLVHLQAPDNANPLSYMDFGLLTEMISGDWALFEAYLPIRDVWNGWSVELKAIRNRIGHVRRPHADDCSRLEQTLRDLEPGVRVALGALATFRLTKDERGGDPVAQAFESGELRTACDHLRRKYGLDVALEYSRLPWAGTTGFRAEAGFLWSFEIGGPNRMLTLSRWSDAITSMGDYIAYALTGANWTRVLIPAVDDPQMVAKVLTAVAQRYPLHTVPNARYRPDEWENDKEHADYRVLVDHPFALLPGVPAAGSYFGA